MGAENRDYTEKAYAMVQDLAAAANDPKHSCNPSRSYEDPFFRKIALDDSIQVTFFQNAWHTRVWCTQEIVLAKRATLVTGHHKIDWALFCEGIEYGEQLGAWNEVQFGVVPMSPADHLATTMLGTPYTEITTRLIATSRNLDVLGFRSPPRQRKY
jgi:hypothetical protein